MKLNIVGQRLRRLRKLVGISRQAIEKRYNISANTIKVWEAGKTEIGIIKLAKYLEIFKEYGVFLSIDNFINSKSDCLDNITIPLRNDLTHNLNEQVPLQSLKNVRDLQLISNTITSTVGLILEKKEEMLQALFDNLPFKIVFKDENNNILRLNNLAAQGLGGTVADFEEKNVYNLFPQRAKKYHEDDLEVLKANTPITIDEEIIPINSVSNKMISVSRTPIFNRENKKMVFITFRDIIHPNQV